MDSYIVRVYRRNTDLPDKEITGLVEEVGSDHKKVFRTMSGLITAIRQIVGQDTADLPYIQKAPPE